jgi:tetratricopeptide (TPR) repeat protein
MMLRSARRHAPPQRKTLRRWHLAPVITHGPEPLEGLQILEENAAALGLLLWHLLRDVALWAITPPNERPHLFAPGAGRRLDLLSTRIAGETEVLTSLRVLRDVVAGAGRCEEHQIATACDHTAQWALRRGRTATGLAFAQAAALVRPTEATAALKVARLSHRRHEHARAETWYRRAITLSRRASDWAPYTNALYRLGTLYQERGNERAAQRFFVRALRAGTRRGILSIRVAALRSLAAIEIQRQRYPLAEKHLRTALETLGFGGPWLLEIAAELARLRVAEGRFEDAFLLLEPLLQAEVDAERRLPLLARWARVAAATQRPGRFEQGWAHAWSALGGNLCDGDRGQVLLDLAHGAASLPDRERATHAATLALETARQIGDRKLRGHADALLKALADAGGAAPVAQPSAGSDGAPSPLVGRLIQAIASRAG